MREAHRDLEDLDQSSASIWLLLGPAGPLALDLGGEQLPGLAPGFRMGSCSLPVLGHVAPMSSQSEGTKEPEDE